jgi:hypothetical protein
MRAEKIIIKIKRTRRPCGAALRLGRGAVAGAVLLCASLVLAGSLAGAASAGPSPIATPTAGGPVYAIASANGVTYIGGSFDTVNGQERHKLAAFDSSGYLLPPMDATVDQTTTTHSCTPIPSSSAETCTYTSTPADDPGCTVTGTPPPDPTCTPPQVSAVVRALVAVGDKVYVGGAFDHLGGIDAAHERHNLAALDASTGSVLPFSASLHRQVLSLAATNLSVFAGGSASTSAGQPAHVTALAPSTGAGQWDVTANSNVYALNASCANLYVGGGFGTYLGSPTIGGQDRDNLAALDAATGAVKDWAPMANGNSSTVYALTRSGSIVYAGGAFNGNIGHYVAALDADTAKPVPNWNPSPDYTVKALAVDGPNLYIGGVFTRIGTDTYEHLAEIGPDGNPVAAFNPGATGPDPTKPYDAEVDALYLSGGALYVGGGFANLGGQPQPNLGAFSVDASSAQTAICSRNSTSTISSGSGANTAGGTTTGPGGGTQPNFSQRLSPSPLTLERFSVSPKRFRVAAAVTRHRDGRRRSTAKGGATFSYLLSDPATVTLSISRVVKTVRRARVCTRRPGARGRRAPAPTPSPSPASSPGARSRPVSTAPSSPRPTRSTAGPPRDRSTSGSWRRRGPTRRADRHLALGSPSLGGGGSSGAAGLGAARPGLRPLAAGLLGLGARDPVG